MKEEIQVKSGPCWAVALPSSRLAVERSRAGEYLELTKPRLTFLVLVTTLVGFCMALKGPLDTMLLFHTILGTALLAGGAAALNQFLERDLDARMKRTGDRPIPSGRLPAGDALLFGAGLCVAGLFYTALTVNLLTSFLGVITVSIYLFAYTPLKQITPLCTLVGAVPGAIPPMMGWSATSGALEPGAWTLFAILFLWQMPHFYALAQMYRDDYARAGFPMLSVVDPDGSRTAFQIISHTLMLIPVSLLPTALGMAGAAYFWGALALGIIFFIFAMHASIFRTIANSRKLFLASIFYLPFLLLLMVAAKLFA